jgi:hypothetical protein
MPGWVDLNRSGAEDCAKPGIEHPTPHNSSVCRMDLELCVLGSRGKDTRLRCHNDGLQIAGHAYGEHVLPAIPLHDRARELLLKERIEVLHARAKIFEGLIW